MLRDVIRGAGAPLRAFALLRKVPRLRRLALAPFLLNVLLFAIGVPVAIWLAVSWAGSLVPGEGTWLGALRVVVRVLAFAAVAVGALFSFSIVGSIIAAPFNSALSQGVEEHLRGEVEGSDRGILRDAIVSVRTALGRLLIFLVLYPPILLTQFIPVVGVFLFPLLSFLYGAFVLSFDFSDPTLERHIPGFRRRIGYLLGRKSRYLPFGAAAFAMMLVPVVNLLLIPLCVAAGAIIYVEEALERHEMTSRDRR